MRLLAALCSAAAVWLAGEALAGRGVRLSRRPSRSRRSSRQVWLSQAGAAVTPGQFWTVSAALAAASFGLLYSVDQTLVVAALPSVGAGMAPYVYWSAQRRRRSASRFEAWPDALRHVVGRLQAGIATLHEALEELSASGPAPLRPAMARYVRLASRIGQRQALEVVRNELADPISDPVLLIFEMAVEEGTEEVLRILAALADQIQGDLQLAERVRTLQTQSRVATWAIFVLPYLLLVFLCATEGLYHHYYSTEQGLVVVLVGLGLSLVGLGIARRLSRPIPTTQRVFVPNGGLP